MLKCMLDFILGTKLDNYTIVLITNVGLLLIALSLYAYWLNLVHNKEDEND